MLEYTTFVWFLLVADGKLKVTENNFCFHGQHFLSILALQRSNIPKLQPSRLVLRHQQVSCSFRFSTNGELQQAGD